ncbi:MAG: RHS repeat-associated core domain-containing protein [Candidatus Muiribacteriota bacterium]
MTKGRENRILQNSDRTFSPSDRANTGTSDQAFSLSDDNNVLNQEIYKAVRSEKLEVSKENQELYFIRDYLGNIKSIFDNNGEMLYYRLYDEFGGEFTGQSRSQDYADQNDLTQPCFTPFGFTSREFDEIADLYFYRSRYYAPTLGRFTQRDKFNEAGFITGNPAVIYNPLQLNDYTYVGNNPLNFIDPWGYCKGEMDTWIYKYMKIKPAWLPPFEINAKQNPGGQYARTYPTGLVIVYGPYYNQQPDLIKESIRYHEFVHVEQEANLLFIFSFFVDAYYAQTRQPNIREIEAYVRQSNLIDAFIKNKNLNNETIKELKDFQNKQVDYFFREPHELIDSPLF